MSFKDLAPWHSQSRGQKTELAPFFSLQNEMNRLFNDVFSGFSMEPFSKRGAAATVFSPSIDVTEKEDKLLVKAELPGIDEKDIDITLTNDHLVIKGQKREEHEEIGDNDRRYVERSFGSFQRVIPLALEIDEEKVDASFKKGVLTIVLPKSAESKTSARKVSVRGA
ncbi:MAG: Hsp20/alpha crystallin family protein [Bdellovibrionales bacterium]|nr:Hsp20/alpha crystallin family protein [Bdellovibrionales bacterium]